jgi:site-specific DNA-adenine methylase
MRVDIDHLGKPFVQIADEWVASLDLTYCDFVLVGPPNLKKFKDKAFNDAWQMYHEDYARLIAVCAAANRSKGASGYETPSEIVGSFAKTNDKEIDLSF